MKKRTKIICSAIILSTACIASSAQKFAKAQVYHLYFLELEVLEIEFQVE